MLRDAPAFSVTGPTGDRSGIDVMNAIDCPNRDRLTDYVSGRLDLGAHSAVEAHLDSCPDCQATADALDGVTAAAFPRLREVPPPDPTLEDPAFRRLVAEVKAFASDASTLPEGAVLGNYELLAPLGAGGMGRVYKARHRRMNRVVALKVLAPELLRAPGARERFRREAEAAARLHHPNVVAAFDAGEADGRDFLVLEYAEGRTLADLVRAEGPLPMRRALDYVAQAARGLAYAHAAGVVHRDVKPANLLVDAVGVVKVLDLGLARLRLPDADAADNGLTADGAVMGTAAYMAPEQAADTSQADARSDVYGLGCCLFFLLTGRPPFEGKTALQTLFAHREAPIPSLRAARPDCPPAVDALFHRMVAKRPEERRPSMAAALAELERLTPAAVPRPVRRRKAWWAAAAAAVLLAGALTAWALSRPSPVVSPRPSDDGQGEPVVVRPPVPPDPEPRITPPVADKSPTPPPADVARSKTPDVAMVQVPAGVFWMGSPESEDAVPADEKPRHRVTISRPFSLGKFKITQAEYEEVMGTNPSAFRRDGKFKGKVGDGDTGRLPVESISWFDAVRFCNALSKRQGLKPYYDADGDKVTVNGGDGYRLPTEAEWEYACRAGSDGRWCFGDDVKLLDKYAWYADNSGGVLHPVGEKLPNRWDLYDMHGDLAEWCWDRYDAEYYKHSPASDPAGAGRDHLGERVLRGGGWDDPAGETRSAARHVLGGGYKILTLAGLRVARDVEP
jgi:serine/threonine protein kinase